MKKNEVISLEAEEFSIDTIINDALEKSSVTDAIISNLKEKYGGLTINGQSDRDGYDAVVEARKECKGWRVLASKVCKKGREKAVAEQKAWVKKEGEVVGKISEIEGYLEKQETDWENEKERIKQEKKRMQDEAFILRQSELNRMGVSYNTGNFELGEVSFDSGTIKEADNEIWENNILPKYKEQYEKNQAEIAEANRIQAEKDAAIAKEREELERQQQELKAQQEAFRKELEEKAALEKKRIDAEHEALKNKRSAQLSKLGLMYDGQQFHLMGINIHWSELITKSENDWVELIDKITPIIQQRKQEVEEKRLAEIEEQKRIAAEKAALEERMRIEAEAKAEAFRLQQIELKKAEELALANDKTKWAAFIKNIEAITHSEMKSPKYKRMQSIAKEKLEDIVQL